MTKPIKSNVNATIPDTFVVVTNHKKNAAIAKTRPRNSPTTFPPKDPIFFRKRYRISLLCGFYNRNYFFLGYFYPK